MKKRIISVLMFAVIISALLVSTVSAEAKQPRLVDGADLLSQSQETAILSRLNEISEKYEYDVVIVTQKSIGNKSEVAFADDYYDYNGYGFGNDYTGLLLLITFDSQGGIWYISTCGKAINAFSNADIEYIGEAMKFDLSNEDYVSAFNTYIDKCDYYINGEVNGFPFEVGKNLVISLVIGFIIAFIAVSVMKGQLKSVNFQKNASTYVKPGSMVVTTARDFFLYSHITRVAKPKDSGSSSHRSSSGRSHGGGGGRF